jgi:hypothetical protein
MGNGCMYAAALGKTQPVGQLLGSVTASDTYFYKQHSFV